MEHRQILATAFAAILGAAPVAAGAETGKPENGLLSTNQAYIERLLDNTALEIENIGDVFWHVFGSLPSEVTVYPTENYYYFEFLHEGGAYAGNIRLDVSDRDQGLVHFAYFRPRRSWQPGGFTHYARLGIGNGVQVEKTGELRYRVEYRDKAVTFQLNGLSHIQPPPDALLADEDYLGPVFDESGVEFYFIYNRALKRFMFVLNEAGISASALAPDSSIPDLAVDGRTGFVYFADPIAPRRLLVGVSQDNIDANNFFDGPFDQLPDNFMPAGALRSAVVDAYPSLVGKLDQFGHFADEAISGRILIDPYWSYRTMEDLRILEGCEELQTDAAQFYGCIFPDD